MLIKTKVVKRKQVENILFEWTVTLRKNVSKYKNMWKWMIEFLRKIENRGIKIALVNSILITKYINLQIFTLILYGVGIYCDRQPLTDCPCIVHL